MRLWRGWWSLIVGILFTLPGALEDLDWWDQTIPDPIKYLLLGSGLILILQFVIPRAVAIYKTVQPKFVNFCERWRFAERRRTFGYSYASVCSLPQKETVTMPWLAEIAQKQAKLGIGAPPHSAPVAEWRDFLEDMYDLSGQWDLETARKRYPLRTAKTP